MNKKSKIIWAWIVLIILIIIVLVLTYLKFFQKLSNNIEERPIEQSSSNVIHDALKDITVNFNQNSKIKKYKEEDDITLIASVNNYSIFISYITNTTTTYEFSYDNLCLNITINNIEEDKTKFNIIYEILIEAVQKRISNTENLDSPISNFLNTNINYEGLTKTKVVNGIKYQMDITTKLQERNGG